MRCGADPLAEGGIRNPAEEVGLVAEEEEHVEGNGEPEHAGPGGGGNRTGSATDARGVSGHRMTWLEKPWALRI